MLARLLKRVFKKINNFLTEDFLICHRCQRHRWCTLSCEYLGEFSKKFETVIMGYSEAGGKLIHEKNLKSKISWHCPFKDSKIRGSYLDQKFSTFVKIFDFFLMTHLFWDHEINYFFISNKNTIGNKNLSTLLARKIASIIPSKYLFCLATICLYVFHFVGTFLYIIMCDPPSWPIILQIKFKLGFT
jgi:hypothetical protein